MGKSCFQPKFISLFGLVDTALTVVNLTMNWLLTRLFFNWVDEMGFDQKMLHLKQRGNRQ
jgi:hypothetical protein